MSTQTDKFIHSALRNACGALCQAIGWNATQSTALDVLSDVLQRYFMDVAKRTHSYAEHSGRTEPNLDDASLVFDDLLIGFPELEEYMKNFDPVKFPGSVPAFPIEREPVLNFLRPGSQEVLTRPVHVHEYMPPMIIEEEPKVRKEKPDLDNPLSSVTSASTFPDKPDGEVEAEKPSAVVNGRANGIDGDSKGMDSEDEDSDNSLLPNSLVSPHSPKTSKSKRLESPGENPALKRVRMMLEEEGHPLREITSVMMTTSGFLTSSREGRLPETKPPPNRDFFEPIISPVPERKKKPTMKKIVEGVKKIDKEKENQNEKEKGESGFNLFEKPDKIFSSPSTSTTSASADKVADKEPAPEKVKEGKESKSKEKKDKSEKKSEKKSKEEKSDKQKLKIFKKKAKDAAKENPVKLKQIKPEPETALEPIESDEDFGTRSGSQSRETSPDKKKSKKEKIFATPKISDKKLKKKSLLGVSPLSKISHKASKVIDPVRIFDNPDKIVPVLIGAQKKKRGRPKKSVSPFNVSLMGGLHGLESPQAPPTSIKPVKFSRKVVPHEEMDMKSFVPEISINVKTPPPPSILHRLPLQPGLIPAFVPPSIKMTNPLPPSISITPATPTVAPSSPAFKDARNSGQFGSLPSNVCSSVTITRIDMSNSQKLPTPFDSQPTPGIGSPNLSNKSNSSSASTVVPIQSDSGITITPIVMDKQSNNQVEKPERPSVHSGLAKLEQNLRTKEQRRKEKEKRKELKKEKKKEKKEKLKEKEKDKLKKVEKSSDKERDKSVKKEKKEKSEKKRKKEREGTTATTAVSAAPVEATVPKLTLKLQHSSTTTPVDSPNPPQAFHGEPVEHPAPAPPAPPPPSAPRKITIKPIEEVRHRTPSPELARFSPLVTRPSKKVPVPKKSPPAVIAKTPKQEVVAFPPVSSSASASANANLKRGRGRPPKSTKTPSKSSTQAGLVTETVGSYIDEHGNKVWICPACGRQDDGSPMIGCEKCDDWYHFTCVGIVEAPDETESWFCKKCVVKEKASNFEHRKKVNRL